MKYLLTILLFVSGVASADITGIAHVTDGDTVKINNTRIRLHGIDAPERNQKCEKYGQEWRCGQASTKLLRTLTTNKTITCKGSSTDRYKRLIAVCYVNGVDLNAAMVDAGLALAYRKYSTQYVPNEHRAKQAKRGLWSGQFVNPWDWRIPLSSRAIKTLREQLRTSQGYTGGVVSLHETPLFSYSPRGLSGEFLKLCRRLGIEDLHFHDLRHEATSRFFEKGLNPVEVATITGHKDPRMLMRYTHLRAEDLVERLG